MVVSVVVLSVVDGLAGGTVSWEEDDEGGVVVGVVVVSAVVLLLASARVVFVAPAELGGKVVRSVVVRVVVVVLGWSESTSPTGPSMLTSASGQVSSSGWIE